MWSRARAARHIDEWPEGDCIGEIVHERRRIAAETALRLARYFHTKAEFWLNLQSFYDREVSRRSGKAAQIEHQVHPAPTLAS